MQPLTATQYKLTAWAGTIAPALFVSVFTIEGFLRPGYNGFSTYVSALSLGPRGWIQIANFMVFGLLFLAFSRGVAQTFPSGKASKWGTILLTTIAVCYFLSGPFIMDPDGTTAKEVTFHGSIHGILGAVAFVCMPISMFVYWRRFNTDEQWKALREWTLILGVICTAALIVLTIVTKFSYFQTSFADWLGLIQRELIVPYMVWIFVFALGLLRQTEPHS